MTFQEIVAEVKDLKAKLTAFVTGKETTEVAAQVAAFQTRIEAVEKASTQAAADLATAQQTIGTLQTQINAKDGEIATLKAEAKTVEESAADKARKLVAGQGVAVEALPTGKEGKSADPKVAAEKEYARLIIEGKSMEAGQFWQKNRELLG
jgi:chromosome segregation ATPase